MISPNVGSGANSKAKMKITAQGRQMRWFTPVIPALWKPRQESFTYLGMHDEF